MSQDTTETVDSTKDTEQDPVIDPDVISENAPADGSEETDNTDELKEKLQKQQEQNQRLFERAKKAEGFEKQPDGSWVKVQKKPKVEEPVKKEPGDVSTMDLYALIEAKVPRDDIDEVKDYAKLKGISVMEALKTPVVKTILAERAEERQTANATNTGKTRTGQNSASGEALYAKAAKTGEIPDRPEDLDKMLEARYTPKS